MARVRAGQVDGQVRQQVGKARGIVTGVDHDHDVRITGLPLPCGDETVDDLPDLGGGDGRDIDAGLQPDEVLASTPAHVSTSTHVQGAA